MNRKSSIRPPAPVVFALLLLPALLSGERVRAAEFSIGAAMAVSTSPYTSHDAYFGAMPFASYEGGRVYLRASGAGVYLWKNERHGIGAEAWHFGLNFDPDDCDDEGMKALDRRRSTLMAGLSYRYTGSFGMLRVGVVRDILGKSDGYAAEASYHIPFTRGKLTLLPGVGASWQSGKHADYYFGVSRGEADRSGVHAYNAKGSFLPFVGVEAKYDITNRLSAVAAFRAELLTGSIRNSPMTGRACTVSGAVGIQFSF